jgi:UDP-2,3-diacylglucosamine pyrophosphatase LpxH
MLDYIARTKKREIDEVLGTPWHLRFALLADTHIWAKACALDELHKFYEDAKAEWVECFVHCWDLVDWCWVYKWQQFEQSEKGFDEQVEKVVKDYPNVWLTTYFIGGNHDESYLKNSWADITRVIDSLREDLVNLGYYDWLLNINWITIQIQHGGGGNSYSKDYKLQRYIDSIEAGQEPDIFGLWHYHQAIHTLQRWIHGFMPWAFLKKNLLAKRFRFPNVIGWWIIDITKDEYGRKRLVATFLNE